MQIMPTLESPARQAVAALAVGVFQDGLSPAAEALDVASGGLIRRLMDMQEFKPEIGQVVHLYCLPGVTAPVVTLTGCGPQSSWDRGAAFRAAATASRALAEKARDRVGYAWSTDLPTEIAASAVAGSVVGCAGSGLYQSQKKRQPPQSVCWWGLTAEALTQGGVLGEAINLTRRLVNEPPQVLYPESFAATAQQVAAETGMEAEVWDLARLEAERCGALLAVAQGSSRPPRLVILRHAGAASVQNPWLALVGKGVTFDSGGLSLKPSEGMKTMKCDMAGAATVLGAMQAIARLKLPLNVIGLAGLVENMPGATAYKLGDVLTTRTGKTIEVQNTDAEGRLVLADVLAVAVDRGASKIVDLATLTGACVVALGLDVAGLMTNHQPWCDSGEGRRRLLRRTCLAAADVSGVFGADQERRRRHEERGRRALGGSDRSCEAAGAVRGRGALDAHRHRRTCLSGEAETLVGRRRQRRAGLHSGRTGTPGDGLRPAAGHSPTGV